MRRQVTARIPKIQPHCERSKDHKGCFVSKELEIAAVVPASSPDGWDEMSAVTGRVFVAQNPEQFTYDADGNMLTDGRFRYTWNGENRLVRAQELVAPTNRSPYTIAYAYDHKGRMVSKRITENDGQDTLVKSIAYLWDGWNIIRETQWPVTSDQWSVGPLATNHYPLVTDYVWGLDLDGTLQGAGGVGGLLAVVRDDGVFLPTYDANGNVSEYVSTDGSIVAHYDYSPFGETLIESGDLASTFTHRFSPKPWCPITGLCEYQMRKYRPEIGRWLSRDPIGEKGGVNQYLITRNSTILRVDILGKSSSWVHTRNVTLETIDCAEITIRANLALEVGEDIRLDGTIVQNMHLTKELYDCATRRLVEAADTKYAEAFSVGEVDFWGVFYLGQSACGTYGKVVWKGVATYYSTMPYANLTIVGPNSNSNSKWNGEWTMDPASDHPAGNLPHIDGYFNSGLHNNVSGLMRLLTYKWDCCGGKHSKSYSYLEISTRQTRPD